jgi:precorrin-2 dehydrogenase/sirohydrochlorin ferrochelatase
VEFGISIIFLFRFPLSAFRFLCSMSYYPIFLELDGQSALVIGGGKVAERKIEGLLACGAIIYIISKGLTDKLKGLIEAGEVTYLGEEFEEKHLQGVSLVIAATDEKGLNHKVSESARKKGLLTNVVDQPAECNFIVPSVVRRGDLLIAISSSGKSPALVKKIRERLEQQFGKEYGTFLLLMGHLREEILSRGLSQEENSRIFQEIVYSEILEALASNDLETVESALGRIVPGDLPLKEILKRIAHS